MAMQRSASIGIGRQFAYLSPMALAMASAVDSGGEPDCLVPQGTH